MNNNVKDLTIVSNKKIAKDVYEMKLQGVGVGDFRKPGKFMNIKLGDKFFLRRPISVADKNKSIVTIVYKALGDGTKYMASLEEGEKLNVMTNLGNGFNDNEIRANQKVAIIGGGIGIPPLYHLAKTIKDYCIDLTVILGFKSVVELFYISEFKALGVKVIIATEDGSACYNGNVLEAIRVNDIKFDRYFACGPKGLLDALVKKYPKNGQLSYEERMACGFGACMGCTCKTKDAEHKRVCVEGPVFCSEEVIVDEK